MEQRALEKQANLIRQTIIEEVFRAGSGHPGGSLSAADILTVLFFEVMNIDPKDPEKEDRDKFVLSKGHAAPALYAALAHRGYFPVEDTYELRKIGGDFQGHPNRDMVPGVEMSTGSLGQGISAAVGMALAARLDKRGQRIFALLGDGEIQEGIVWEAVMSAGHYHLDNLIAVVDWNGLQIDGKNNEVMTITPIAEKFKAFGWETVICDGHSIPSLLEAFEKATGKDDSDKPVAIIAKTHKGQGVSFMTDQVGWHGKAPDREQYEQAMKELGGVIRD